MAISAGDFDQDQEPDMKKRATIYSLCAAAMTIGSLALGAAPASASIHNTPGYFHLVNAGSGKCIDATDSGAVQWRCLNTFNEEWQFVDVGDGFYLEIVSHSNGECLTLQDPDVNGAAVGRAPCADHLVPAQAWFLSDQYSSPFMLVNALVTVSSKCLDLENGDTSDGVPMQTWDCNFNTNNQRWRQL
jgi:hypothetical protein